MKRNLIIVILIVAVIAGYFGFRSVQARQAAQQSRYQTAELARGSLVSIVGATGTARANQSAVLAWQVTGQIGEVHVDLGDEVPAGMVLAELAERSLPQNVILARAELVSARKALDDLLNYELAAAEARLAVTNAMEALERAQNERASKDYARTDEETLETARANYLLAENEVDKYERIYDMVDHLPEDNPERLAAFSAWMAARQNRDRALANLNYLESKPDPEEVARADANLALAQAQLEEARRRYEQIKDGPSEDEIAAAEARIAAAEATLALARLEAPFAGTITEVHAKSGDQVSPGTISFRLDDLSRLLIDVQISEVDINRVKVGQRATVSFDAILNKEYQAEVVRVARAGSNVQGIVYFAVTLEILDPDEQVLPGMTGAVNIVIEQLEDVLLVPNRAVRLRDGQQVVYLLSGDQLAGVRNRKVGFVFQSFNLLPRASALANVELPLRYAGVTSGRAERARQALELVGLGDRIHHKPTELSGGQQQRVAIARALINNPSILMADEPTGNLDSKSGKEIMELILQLNRERGTTVIIVTHDPSIADQTGRIIRLHDGQIVEEQYA